MDRKKFIELIGRSPKKSELNTKILEEIDCGVYVRKKILFSSEKNEEIPAFLCIPKKTKKMAAIFCHHQHAGNHLLGKSEVVGIEGAKDQAYAKELAELGFITLSPDSICFEERADQESPRDYHVHELTNRLMQGQTLLGKILFDMSAGIDLLCSLKETDESRIGFIGHSYGGRTGLFAPVFDQRIKTSVSSCGSTNFKDMLSNDTGIQLDFIVQDFLNHGDIEDIVKLVNPSNMLIIGTSDDKWSMSINEIFAHATASFTEGVLQTKIFEGKHQFSPEMRQLSYNFLQKYLT